MLFSTREGADCQQSRDGREGHADLLGDDEDRQDDGAVPLEELDTVRRRHVEHSREGSPQSRNPASGSGRPGTAAMVRDMTGRVKGASSASGPSPQPQWPGRRGRLLTAGRGALRP
jgi:hypothetical protein